MFRSGFALAVIWARSDLGSFGATISNPKGKKDIEKVSELSFAQSGFTLWQEVGVQTIRRCQVVKSGL
jgi:hypothetical protein